jgi:uncharacterized membrane protein YhhN
MTTSVLAYGLLIIGSAAFILGFAFGRLDAERAHRSPTWTRMLNSAALVLAALALWRGVASGTPLVAYAGLVCGGMALSFLGDILMARLIRLPLHPAPGMVAFGLAHVLYIIGYAQAGQALGLRNPVAWGAAVAVAVLLGIVVWRLVAYNPREEAVLLYGALGYTVLLAAMTGAAAALALQDGRFTLLAVGALLFLISDAILANRLFHHNNWLLVGDLVWAIYIAGQSLIVFTLPLLQP